MNDLFKPGFAAWVGAWAVTTFASAAFVVGFEADGPAGWAQAVFSVADTVPPLAKIAFGATLALVAWVLGVLPIPPLFAMVFAVILVPVAFALAVVVYPLGYYGTFDPSAFWPGHLIAAIIGGAFYGGILASGRRRAASRGAPV